ncbi:Glycerol-3-phosphate acyltransferase 1 [Nymphaea thermarum]|nr:Glycerol-3-phosphate acyltransferase 1 [Nymphaea thermarum]
MVPATGFLRLVELVQILANSYYRAARKIRAPSLQARAAGPRMQPTELPYPSVTKCGRTGHTVVCDINGCLLRSSSSFFPYFMLVAFEGGSILRALLLLVAYPFLHFLNHDAGMRAMVFISFCGLKLKDVQTVARAVLPKFFLQELHLQAYEVVAAATRKVVITSVPRVLVEGFLREYLNVDVVVGTELQMVRGRFTGFLTTSGLPVKDKALKEIFGDSKPDVGLGSTSSEDQHLLTLCKEAYVVYRQDEKNGLPSSIMPREKYPKPLVFHDGRLAFLPTPMASLIMFLWLPFAFPLAIFRIVIGISLPMKFARAIAAMDGVQIRVKGLDRVDRNAQKGVLYVCSHRTLLDPVILSSALQKPLSAVTYSVSRTSEILSPIKTVRLTRNRERDAETMNRLLKEGDLVVCPEGTTCREPYLLRFSSLFAELADDIVPVAMNTSVSMFYGTTASGFKCLDPLFFMMNPSPVYEVEILGLLPREMTCAGGKSSWDVANFIQKQMADALGFECTKLTRRDKYLMLAGNEGIVPQKK